MVQRWVLDDAALGETWTFPVNPNQMTSPHAPRSLTVFAVSPLYNPQVEARGGMARVFEGNQEPYEWSFAGYIRDQDHHDQLVYWTRKVTKIQLTDHLARTWAIRMVSLDLDEQKPRELQRWRFDYEVKALNYGRVS